MAPRRLGAIAPRCLGAIAPWCLGALVPWRHGALVPWPHGALVPWYHGAMELWCLGALVPWRHGALVPWHHGAKRPWCHGARYPTLQRHHHGRPLYVRRRSLLEASLALQSTVTKTSNCGMPPRTDVVLGASLSSYAALRITKILQLRCRWFSRKAT
ncbi:hypothetical protein CQW23_35693 [Capsicum baccatum]|uniref:Secreted protein n=1 Tax=Capsicum baccatum TaxID=33114 RepID=A0A2G2UV80_CAPBA|nr:hypothetical protein CQW23_35693 [Capsicum baccatum]